MRKLRDEARKTEQPTLLPLAAKDSTLLTNYDKVLLQNEYLFQK